MGSASDQSEFADFSKPTDFIDLGMCFLCILCAALAAGLTIGLISIDHKELKLLTINGTDAEKAQAKKILPIIKDHHWLLVTLFLFNAIANEALPIFLSGLVPEYVAIILSTFCVLIFGEIIPSSIFSGPSQLKIAANLSWVVKFLMLIFYVVARPIGYFLDWWLGKHDEESNPFNARDLYTLLSLSRDPLQIRTRSHGRSLGDAAALEESLLSEADVASERQRAPSILSRMSDDASNLLTADAVTIAQGAIVSSRRTVSTVCKKEYFTVSGFDDVTIEWMEMVGKTGYSRVLIEENNLRIHYFVVKEVLCDIGRYLRSPFKVRDLPNYPILFFASQYRILDSLNKMQRGESRVGAVTVNGSNKSPILGFFSMEDIVECIIQEDINDEKDSKHQLNALIQNRSISYASQV